MKTLMTIAQQKAFIDQNYQAAQIEHKWSSRGYGNSKFLDLHGTLLVTRRGCGYDRFGSALGGLIEVLFQNELNKLGERFCKVERNGNIKTSSDFYGLFYNTKEKRAFVDGACGDSCMKKILNVIGFEFKYINDTKGSVTGSEFYQITPISAHVRKHVVARIK